MLRRSEKQGMATADEAQPFGYRAIGASCLVRCCYHAGQQTGGGCQAFLDTCPYGWSKREVLCFEKQPVAVRMLLRWDVAVSTNWGSFL